MRVNLLQVIAQAGLRVFAVNLEQRVQRWRQRFGSRTLGPQFDDHGAGQRPRLHGLLQGADAIPAVIGKAQPASLHFFVQLLEHRTPRDHQHFGQEGRIAVVRTRPGRLGSGRINPLPPRHGLVFDLLFGRLHGQARDARQQHDDDKHPPAAPMRPGLRERILH